MRWRGHVFGQRSVGSSSSALAWSWAVGRGVDADGVESGVAEQLSDDDEVGAAADEGGGDGSWATDPQFGLRGVSKDVGGGLVVQAGIVGDLAEDAAGSAGGEAAAAIVE